MQPAGKSVPCRLYVILAKEAPTGVIFRRGPSKWVQIIRWNTDADTFEPGQWFHGRIYEEECDISPDGTRMIYPATKYTSQDDSLGYAWTAVSKVPYLTALALFAHKSGGVRGGGLFLSNDEVWLNYEPAPGANTFIPHKGRCPAGLKVTAHRIIENELELRLTHNGWVNQEKLHQVKPLAIYRNTLSQISEGHSFVLIDKKRNLQIPLAGAVWADWDRRGRLVYAKEGKLFTGEWDDKDQIRSTEIANFNANKPEPREAPDWAKVW